MLWPLYHRVSNNKTFAITNQNIGFSFQIMFLVFGKTTGINNPHGSNEEVRAASQQQKNKRQGVARSTFTTISTDVSTDKSTLRISLCKTLLTESKLSYQKLLVLSIIHNSFQLDGGY